jgi:hypothetical protein
MYQSRCGLSQAVILQKSLYGSKTDGEKSAEFASVCIREVIEKPAETESCGFYLI